MLHSVLPSTIQWGAVTVCPPPPQLCGCSLGGHTGAATARQICAMCSSAMHIWKQPWSHRAFSHFIKQPRGKNCFQTWVCSLKPAYIHATVSRRYFKKGISRGQLVTWQQNYLTLLKNQGWLNEKKKAHETRQYSLISNQNNTYTCASKTLSDYGFILWKFWKIRVSLFENFAGFVPRHLPTSSTAPWLGHWLAQGFQVCVGLETKLLLGFTVSRIYSFRIASPWERLWSKALLSD